MKIFEKVKSMVRRGKTAVSLAVASSAMSLMALTCSAATGETPVSYDVGSAISGIGPKVLDAAVKIITACIDLAVGMVPIGLAFVGATMVIRKGKSMLTKAA